MHTHTHTQVQAHAPAWGRWPPPPPSPSSRSPPSSQPPSLPGRCGLLRVQGHSQWSWGQSATKQVNKHSTNAVNKYTVNKHSQHMQSINSQQTQSTYAVNKQSTTTQPTNTVNIHTAQLQTVVTVSGQQPRTEGRGGAHLECDLGQAARTSDVEPEDGNTKIPFSFHCLFTGIELATMVYVLTTRVAPAGNHGNGKYRLADTRILGKCIHITASTLHTECWSLIGQLLLVDS